MVKRQNKISFFAIILMVVITAGCTEPTTEISRKEISASSDFSKSAANSVEDPIQKGMDIDFSAYSTKQSYQPVIKVLKQNMIAWVNKDKEAFKNTFIDQNAFENHLFLIDSADQIRFIGKPVMNEQESGRIDINVQYELRSANDEGTKEKGVTYNMDQNAQGEWKVSQID